MPAYIEVKDLSKQFKGTEFPQRGKHFVQALDRISIAIEEGEVLGLVGESGSGKSVLGRILMQLLAPTSGEVLYRGEDVGGFSPDRMKGIHDRVQLIYQRPRAALNPRMTIGDLVRAPLDIRRMGSPAERLERVVEMLKEVGLDPAVRSLKPHDYPEEQLQQVLLARALITRPELLVYDEPVSALESSNRPVILKLLQNLQETYGFTMIFISHDIGSTTHISDRMAVMYLGTLTEIADVEELHGYPLHPYTKMLIPHDPKRDHGQDPCLVLLGNGEQGPCEVPQGCPFHPRCPYATLRCQEERPALRKIRDGHLAACHWSRPDGSIDSGEDQPLKRALKG